MLGMRAVGSVGGRRGAVDPDLVVDGAALRCASLSLPAAAVAVTAVTICMAEGVATVARALANVGGDDATNSCPWCRLMLFLPSCFAP